MPSTIEEDTTIPEQPVAPEEDKTEHTENIKNSLNKFFNKSDDPLEKLEEKVKVEPSEDAGFGVTPEMVDGYLVKLSNFTSSMEGNSYVQKQPWVPQYVIPGVLTTITYTRKAVPLGFTGVEKFQELKKEFEHDLWTIFLGIIYLFAGGRLMFAMLASQVFMTAAWPAIKNTISILYADYEKIQALITKKDIAMISDVMTGKLNVMSIVNDVKSQVADVTSTVTDATSNVDANSIDADALLAAKAQAEETAAKAEEMAAKAKEMQRGVEEVRAKVDAAMAICDPTTISDGFQGVYTGMMAVCALVNPTVRGISTGAAIGDNLHKFLLPFVTPLLEKHVPIKNAHKWILEGLTYGCKAVGVFVGLVLSRFSMFFMTASKGAELITQGVHYLLADRLKRPGLESPPVRSAVQTGLTVVGFVCQAIGYMPFLIWILCLPGFMADSILRAFLLESSE